MIVFPTYRKCFIYLQGLAGLYAAATQNTLVGVVPIEWVGIVDFIGLRSIRSLLVLNLQQLRCVMNRAVAVVVVANGTVEKVVPQDAVEHFASSRFSLPRTGDNSHPASHRGSATP